MPRWNKYVRDFHIEHCKVDGMNFSLMYGKAVCDPKFPIPGWPAK